MNSRVFVQPSMDIPEGSFPTTDKVSGTAPNKVSGAIVRPVSRQIDGQGSIRLDPAQDASPPKSHVRNFDLESYVKWLKGKIEADKRDTRSASKKPTEVAPQVNPIETSASQPINFVAKPALAKTTKTILVELPNSEPAAIDSLPLESVSNESLDTTTSDVGAAQANLEPSDEFFSTVTDTDLVQILDMQPVLIAPTKGVRFEEFSELGNTLEKHLRFDDSHTPADDESQRVALAQAHVSFPDPTTLEEPGDSVQISAQDTDSFISAISKAIASVLTETSEPELEEKVRTHFESELHAKAIQSLKPTVTQDITTEAEEAEHPASDQTGSDEEEPAMAISIDGVESVQLGEGESLSFANAPDFEPTVSIVSEAEQIAAEILSTTSKEIPTGVAAWDVDDFRWPVVTNQMIVSGGSAINELADSTFSMISPSFQRLAITGLGRGDGTSSIAITLARWVAAIGKKVLLVDADISNPGLSSQVGLAPNISWINAVGQSLPAAEVIVRSQKSNLCIMPLASTVARSTWPRFVYDSLGELIDEVRSHFDLVIIDAGPSSQLLAELSLPQHLVDATLMVHDGVNSPDFQRAKNMLEGFGINKFIVARNRAPQASSNVA